ncbi:MAG: alcohol dehydrogenase [Confluentimicrobium sp.]|jgi:NADPH2:quinone reductase|uniref:quinone oxidoreductase family protein n=1 Tax=Actibacterium sp. TaxID=1872125 RepID=UPI000C635C16|nr:quinone oxidoreductase [Actibacterium sp.]MBC55642.1 alcohol dehydrogenase [Actibacterium sp.]|tara:strand:- start:10838 stop:11815 length:978 start_codon:yes stop_codon:yes gene_type:complete
MKAESVVRMTGVGGVENLELVDLPPEPLPPGMVRIRHAAIGVNFIDIYHRTGLYPLPLPATPGVEGAGIVEALGDGVCGHSIGDRVAYAGAPVGAYATARAIPASRLVKLPDEIPFRNAAASMLKGLTAHMLLTRTWPVKAGDTLLVHGAAGGLGSVLVRWAKHLGARVIGTAGSPQKARIARGYGVDHVIVGRDADLVAEVADLTGGIGADYTIDGIGGGMVLKSLACTRRFGMVASIGQAAGPIPALPVEEIGPARSLSFARPSVMAYAADQAAYGAATEALLKVMLLGISAEIGREYPLTEAGQAQADLEAGRTTGSLLLLP